jgi:CheY-like chemotaxis protein
MTAGWREMPARAPDRPASSPSSSSSSSSGGAGESSQKTDPDVRAQARTLADIQRPSPSAATRVLIVEDNHMSASALRSIFTRKGCDVAAVGTVKDALATLADGRRDYIVLDLMLPDGDGLEILRRVQSLYGDRGKGGEGGASAAPEVPRVVVTTAVSDPEKLREVQALKPHRLLNKPIDLVDLLSAIGMM